MEARKAAKRKEADHAKPSLSRKKARPTAGAAAAEAAKSVKQEVARAGPALGETVNLPHPPLYLH